jgi:uncharacterized protein
MSATPATRGARSLQRRDLPEVVHELGTNFGREPASQGWRRHQFLLDALDRGELDRFALWPERSVRALVYVGTSGTVVPAGDEEAGAALAAAADSSSWRVLIGDAPVARAVVEASGRGVFRRRASAREQRFMVAEHVPDAVDPPAGMRLAALGDLGVVTEFACALHVEDQMGPPIPRSSRAGVRSRMRDSILRGTTWVVERQGRPVGKVDLSISSPRRGAQIAGVYVDPAHRGGGIAGTCVAAVSRTLLDAGIPCVTLHVRSDNAAALRAYHRAGFVDRGPWLLALR